MYSVVFFYEGPLGAVLQEPLKLSNNYYGVGGYSFSLTENGIAENALQELVTKSKGASPRIGIPLCLVVGRAKYNDKNRLESATASGARTVGEDNDNCYYGTVAVDKNGVATVTFLGSEYNVERAIGEAIIETEPGKTQTYASYNLYVNGSLDPADPGVKENWGSITATMDKIAIPKPKAN